MQSRLVNARMSFAPYGIVSLLRLISILCLLLVAFPLQSFASEKGDEWLAKIVSAQGNVQARRSGESRWINVKLDDTIFPGDMIRVLENSRAALLLRNETIVRLDQNTTITLPGIEKERTINLDFLSGVALFFSRFPFSLQIFTPFVNANIEGTEFLVQVGKTETSLSVYEGKVNASNQAGSLVLTRGESASAKAGEPPALKTVARPRDAVQWALYYPPISDRDLEDVLSGAQPADRSFKESFESYKRGDLTGALAFLENAGPDSGGPAFYAYRAMLLMTVGRTVEAVSDLKKSLSLDPRYSYAYSLQSIIELVQNRKDAALELAKKAVALNGSSSAALIALSYALQARFDLDGALLSAKKATDLDPNDALAWARIAELWLSKGYLDEALDAAQTAVERNPGLARTQTVLGYAYLTRIKIDESRRSFRKAIELDQADPLPRLGLGLALIRDGDLKAGRAEIEIAAMLDPNNSLIRSYLGKAYYEEKQDKKASDELKIAKELDPFDPTPWFYDAIRKQTVNRPVEAMEDLQQSIKLNDNRAVYRSRLLLDEDLAARSVSLARIYEDLGFEWLALTEGSKSLELDPANFSAHRFLADSFFSLPNHDIARVSELLQSQLLQPINIMPIQPQLADSNHFLVSGPGFRDPSYNEYAPLFTRNQLALLLDGAAGERGTLGEDVVQSGVQGKFSYSLGQFHLQSDGFRKNDDQSNNIYDAFAQLSLSPRTSIQAEYRHKNVEMGDLQLLFDPAAFDEFLREKDTREMFRVGFHHSFEPGSDLIGSFMYQSLGTDFRASDYDVTQDQTGYGVEVQHIYRSERFNLVMGAGHFHRDDKEVFSFSGMDFPSDFNTNHTDLYIYSHLNYPKDLVWTFGVSADFFKGGALDQDTRQPNPKFGVTWTPFSGTTLRGAVFRTFNRTLLTDQTVEPTQIAGFNQFFDDGEGTDAWCYGVGLDQKITDHLFAGAEISRRELSIPVTSISPPFGVTTSDANSDVGRAYLYWTPHKWFSLGPEYQYERISFGPELPAYQLSHIETHRVGLGMGFYHPSGLFARLRPAFVSQDCDSRIFPLGSVTSGDSNFFVLDASVGYRLPKRLGLIELVAKNLFDESFRFQDLDPTNPQYPPRRFVEARWTLSF
jgi:tetratricopeptide (TPR) repeat protein